MSEPPMDVAHEHAVLSRHLGKIQGRISSLIKEKDLALEALTCEIVQLRAQLVIARTFVLWGMDMQSMNRKVRVSTSVQPLIDESLDLEAARKAICQTGCTGHAHHWLSDDGQCRRSGRACDASAD
ncbi:hypothetical protein [Polaromonas sp. YR568]|uniref:hypothetical protein n=1 Tax=Polaromonas sp. YR568 TaxID=1855301 RepID=UPI0031377F30